MSQTLCEGDSRDGKKSRNTNLLLAPRIATAGSGRSEKLIRRFGRFIIDQTRVPMKNLPVIIAALLVGSVLSCNFKEAEGKNETQSPVNALGMSETAKTPENKSQACKDVVMEILTASPRFEDLTKGLHDAVVKNGGTAFGITLEGSPEADKDALDYSPTYDFSLHETYPDRNVAIARFTFNPNEQQLYEYDAITDKLNPIAFDKNLLEKFKQFCR